MRKFSWLIIISWFIVFIGCNHPGLNEQQRKQLNEGKQERAIRKVTEAQIIETTLVKGNEIVKVLNLPKDTITPFYKAVWLYDTMAAKSGKIQEIREAYSYALENNQEASDYAEVYNKDTLLFAKPARYGADRGVWFVFLNKKEVVEEID